MKKRKTVLLLIFALTLLASAANGGQTEIRILHVNDFHGFAEPYKPMGSDEWYGGIAYLAARVRDLRKEKASLLVAAGDMIQGNNWANFFEGRSVIELMNLVGFDAMVAGNHEFDFGQEVLRKRISEANFPVLGANVEGRTGLQPYVIRNLNGVKVAIIGVVTEEAPVTTSPRNVAGLKFFSPADTVEKWVRELKDQADVVIVLSHIGHQADRLLAENVPGVDVIVGGHSHTKVKKPVSIGNVIIVQAWEHAKALGVLDLTVEDGKVAKFDGYLDEVKPQAGKSEGKVEAIVEAYRGKLEGILSERVGEAEVDLDGENVRRRETNLGNLISDIIRKKSGADTAMINGGGIRASLRKGDLKVKDVYSVLPFDTYIVAIELTGRQIREALEHGVSGVEEDQGRFPQVSGIAFKYFLSEKKGSRVREVLIGGEPIDLNKTYRVAINDFLAAGGDGYKVFAEVATEGEKVVYNDSGRWLRDVVIEYLREVKQVHAKVEGRIIEVR